MPVLCRAAAVVVLVAILFVMPASPADAHAVLLRSEPAPQATLPSPPAAVRLEFSEAVEVAFGAISVFDVDGTSVEVGSVERAQEDREVLATLPPLGDGTYTVTWRAVSGDGHGLRGGFQFYVGAPSSISPVAVAEEGGAATSTTWGFGVVRFVWFAALLALIGIVAVRRWVWTPAVREAGLTESPAAARFRRLFALGLPAALAVLFVTGVAMLVFQAASVSGLSFLSSARPSVLGEVFDTTYGRAWLAQAAFTVALVLPVAGLVRRRGLAGIGPDVWIGLGAVLVAGVCVATVFSGHARTDPRPALALASVAVHLFAAGIWVGGLGALVVVGISSSLVLAGPDRVGLLRVVVPRFSRLAIGAVVVVVGTGVINSIGNLDGIADLWRVAYGRVLAIKVMLVVVALGLAWRHLRLPKRLVDVGGADAVRSFGRTSRLETALLVAVTGLAAALVVLVPGRSIALAAKAPVNQTERADDYTVQLLVDPSAPGANEIHVTFVDPRGLGAAEVTRADASLTWPDGQTRPLALRLITSGHFVADEVLPARGPWSLVVSGEGAPSPLSATFRFQLVTPTSNN